MEWLGRLHGKGQRFREGLRLEVTFNTIPWGVVGMSRGRAIRESGGDGWAGKF